MSKRAYINRIRQIINNPGLPPIDYSKWTDNDLRELAAIQTKYGERLHTIKESDLTGDELDVLNRLSNKYLE